MKQPTLVKDRNPIKEAEAIRSLIEKVVENGGAFSLWRMPDSTEKVLLICTSGTTEVEEVSLEESVTGFVFAPFNPAKKKIFIKADLIYRFRDGQLAEGSEFYETFLGSNSIPENSDEKRKIKFHTRQPESQLPNDYKQLVELSVRQIEEGVFEKIVPSRFRDIELPLTFDMIKAFELLDTRHPQALISLVSSPLSGTWLGATPELLVSIDKNLKFTTHALAGTLPYSPSIDLKSVAWTQKEIEEQALVSRYIINCFKKIRVREYTEQGPKTVVAGNVMHLKTDYAIDMNEVNFPQLGSVMLKLLHPTSAVCGMPLAVSLEFLEKHEGYDREFYSGFLGPVNFESESRIFVNLRCMQLFDNSVRLYAGAGVTQDSVPEKEWEETEIKMRNLLDVLSEK